MSARILAILLLATTIPCVAQGFLSFDDERAKGNLDNDAPGLFIYCPPAGCKVVGSIGGTNVISWSDDVTLEDLKGIVQSQADLTRWQANRARKFLEEHK